MWCTCGIWYPRCFVSLLTNSLQHLRCCPLLSVALNFQTAGEGMDLNDGLFRQNGNCGYVLKPSFMRVAEKRFDPETPHKRDGYKPIVLTVQVRSAAGRSSHLWGTSLMARMHFRWLAVSSCPKSTSKKTLLWILWLEWRFTAFLWTRPSRRPDTSRTMVRERLWTLFAVKLIHRAHDWIKRTSSILEVACHVTFATLIYSLQGSTLCGTIRSVSPSTPQSWPWCASWWRTMTRHPKMILWASTRSLSAACSKVKLLNGFFSTNGPLKENVQNFSVHCFYGIR